MKSRRDLAAVLVLAAATLAYALAVIKDFSGPLLGADDINALENLGFMMEKQLSFGAVPHLALVASKQVLYPWGARVVFLPWGVERDLVYTLFHSSFGEGPWLQLYQTASVFVSSLGTYLLLRREEGAARALLVALAGTFMNFYAVYKYPHHLNVSTMHWTILAIVVDFLLFRRLVRGERWTARLLLARVALTFLGLGLDLGYVTGFALLSLATTFVGFVVLVAVRWRRGDRAPILPSAPFSELRAHPVQSAVLALLLLAGAWLYLPIVFDIYRATTSFKFEGPGGSFWASQFRLLFPYLPFVGPPSKLVHDIFGDAEGIGEFSTGWALLAIAFLGLRSARRSRSLLVYAPILAAFVLSFAYHPRELPTLRIFPWFQFDRVAGRATLVFPIWFALVGLAWRPALEAGSRARRLAAALGALALIETVTGYASFDYRPWRADASFWAYMKVEREAPGEAVLDWPFCVAGGNDVGTDKLCPYYALTSTTYAYRRFTGKDVVGLLLSRMTKEQAQPFFDLGFPRLFTPDKPGIRDARRQTRCFDDADWTLFDGFYRGHDFAGISLYTDLLPPACVDAFHARYGLPIAETHLPAEGRAEFIPRRP